MVDIGIKQTGVQILALSKDELQSQIHGLKPSKIEKRTDFAAGQPLKFERTGLIDLGKRVITAEKKQTPPPPPPRRRPLIATPLTLPPFQEPIAKKNPNKGRPLPPTPNEIPPPLPPRDVAPPPLPPREPIKPAATEVKKRPNAGRPLPPIPVKVRPEPLPRDIDPPLKTPPEPLPRDIDPPPLPPRDTEPVKRNIFVRAAIAVRDVAVKVFVAIKKFFEKVFSFFGKVTHIRFGKKVVHFKETDSSDKVEITKAVKSDDMKSTDKDEEVVSVEIPEGELKEGLKKAKEVGVEALKVMEEVDGVLAQDAPPPLPPRDNFIPPAPPLPSKGWKSSRRKQKQQAEKAPVSTVEEKPKKKKSPMGEGLFNALREGLADLRNRMHLDDDDDDDDDNNAFFGMGFKDSHGNKTELSVSPDFDRVEVKRERAKVRREINPNALFGAFEKNFLNRRH